LHQKKFENRDLNWFRTTPTDIHNNVKKTAVCVLDSSSLLQLFPNIAPPLHYHGVLSNR